MSQNLTNNLSLLDKQDDVFRRVYDFVVAGSFSHTTGAAQVLCIL